ncbi:hypothetical protein MNBD_GAMMA23-411 [hydrothermal vent metagenome]|uniref:DUF3379 domain-containing protein n=1 Tax=hydrothermal vent metagenome TaxID=652676 RepID=A0A3B0ZTA7_9ZZZZ
MNCIDAHRKLTTAPSIRDDTLNNHLQACSACAKFAESVEQLDHSIHDAANINVPDGLAERILLKHSFKQQHRLRTTRFKFYVMAASVILVFGLSLHFNYLPWQKNALSLGDVAINHVTNEMNHLNENNNVQLAKLNRVLQPFNIKFTSAIGRVSYAGACPIRNSRGAHIVLSTENETVTLLVMPGEYVNTRTSLTKSGFKTTIVPTKNGSIAIITPQNSKAELQQSIENSLNQAIEYI